MLARMPANMLSVTDPIAPAWNRTRRMLFDDFALRKWFVLGFCAFLAQLGEGGGSSLRVPADILGRTVPANAAPIERWTSEHAGLLVGLGCGVLLLALALGLLLLWLGSRGKYMFLDGVVHDRAAVAKPWRRFRSLGNSLMALRLLLALAAILAIMLAAGLGALLAWPDIARREFGAAALAGLLAGCGLFFVILVPLAVAGLLLDDFVVPISYHRNLSAGTAFRVLWREVLPGNGAAFFLFYLMKIVLGMGAALLIILGICLTCCLGALPYLSSVVFLPVFVFFRNYTLGFLAQVGPEWDLLSGAAEEGR